MIAYAEALALARAAGARRRMPEELVPLAAAAGRVAARAIVSPESVPAFANSGMDGFAVRAADLAGASPGAPVTLPVPLSIAAGDEPSGAAPVDGAIEIMTGAPIPAGRDAVVRVEDVEVRRDAAGDAIAATFRAPVEPGRHVRPAGEDFAHGDLVAAEGELLGPHHLLALATLGIAEVPVRRRPRVAIVSTGKELLPFKTKELPPGAIRNSTASYLAAALPTFGAEVLSTTSIGDDEDALRRALERARLSGADVVLTTGAVSAGKHDFVSAVLARLDARLSFHKVASRPGKPALLAELPDGPAVIGLPGNPVASAVALRSYAVPLLRAALGLPDEAPLRAVLRDDAAKPAGFRCVYTAVARDGAVEVLAGQGSAIVSSLLRANAWAVLPEEPAVVPAGTEIDVFPLHGLHRALAAPTSGDA